MLVVDPSSSCDICLEPFEWNSTDRTPHIIDCGRFSNYSPHITDSNNFLLEGHVFCAECLHQVFPTKCPLCRKLFLPSEIRKLHVECSSDADKEEVELLKQLISAYDSSEEELLRLRIRVDAWLAARTLDEQSPLRQARDALEQYQQLKLKSVRYRMKIKTLERAARQWERTAQDNVVQKEAEAAIMEQTLRSQLTEQQTQIAQLRAELDKKQAQIDRNKAKKAASAPSKPLPLPKIPLHISNPLPAPPRLFPVTQSKPSWPVEPSFRVRGHYAQSPRFPILERDDGFDSQEENLAFFTCQTAPYVPLNEDEYVDVPRLQRSVGSTQC
ncbi:hypothetical protein FB446DRAFT_800833 [Lentinula raphanica]|nr:hypothetical protein FB446DRAFT_800833 [Lentinula raphanica]